MSDAQILRALKLDLSKLKKTVGRGADGSSVTYSDGENIICITDSAVSGKGVARMAPFTEVWSTPDHPDHDSRGRLNYTSYRGDFSKLPTPTAPP